MSMTGWCPEASEHSVFSIANLSWTSPYPERRLRNRSRHELLPSDLLNFVPAIGLIELPLQGCIDTGDFVPRRLHRTLKFDHFFSKTFRCRSEMCVPLASGRWRRYVDEENASIIFLINMRQLISQVSEISDSVIEASMAVILAPCHCSV